MQFKLPPLPHQLKEFHRTRDFSAWGLYWDMRTGKSKVVIDTWAHLVETQRVGGLVVVAPSGVHQNWTHDEIPKHLPDALAERTKILLWNSSKSTRKWFQDEAEAVLAHDGPIVVAMAYDAVRTDRGGKFMRRVFDSRPCLLCLDESHKIKSPKAKITKRLLAAAKHAPYRRLLTGTLAEQSPFDVYSQLMFLDPAAWRGLGISGAEGFRNFFGEFRTIAPGNGRRPWKELVCYRALDLLNKVVMRYGSRVLKADVNDNLPRRTYSKRYFELTSEQRRLYSEIQRNAETTIEGEEVTAELAITRLLRCQQITSGFLPVDANEEDPDARPVLTRIPGKNPRLATFLDMLEEVGDEKVIVWTKYRQDVDMLLESLRAAGKKAVRYDGQCTEDEAYQAKVGFKTGDAQFFVSNPSKGAEGLNLNEASIMVFYNTTFRLGQRRQAEDRNFDNWQKAEQVHVIDLVAEGTVDEKIINALRENRDVVDQVMGDPSSEWI